MLRTGAVLLALVMVAGCSSSRIPADQPEPVLRHLVYEKLIGDKKGVWIADVDGGHARLLVRGGRVPVISPDGKWVVYTGGCDPEDEDVCEGTFVVSTSGGKPRRLSSDVDIRPPSYTWSPDSTRIVVARDISIDEQSLVSIDLASGKELTLDEGGFWRSFSPDGKQIVYARARPSVENSSGRKVDLFIVDSAGGEPKRITDTGDSAAPVWGPKSIAFARLVPDGEWGQSEIWEIQPDGSGLKTITGPLPEHFRGVDGVIPVAWSDDGRALLGGWLSASGAIPLAVDPERGTIRELQGDGYSTAVAISRDGRLVLAYTYPTIGGFDEDSARVLIVPYGGGKATTVARGATAPSWNR